ncbi:MULTISPECIES: hypothetical protein [unclassified Burkholderia]|uniref:hypothetical protein n=1 Tax=unclassified Burkholderia TaxID=2613784 RepID=UPI0014209A34|nr:MULTISPECIES: hypothetical protein [unclassified Burkholderia]NIE86018.1 hypothetical protein [Burkholderia sp. Tr-860]NIF64457.1 hypothetical protein [Burkholderia sp. Cy-647]NIF72979.1 hypothetical protein [Burkholderia sp. Ap-962]
MNDAGLPLDGIEVLEFEGLGPAPLAGWMLAALGARAAAEAPDEAGRAALNILLRSGWPGLARR